MMREYIKEAGYGALWGIIIGLIGTGILWTVGSIVIYLL